VEKAPEDCPLVETIIPANKVSRRRGRKEVGRGGGEVGAHSNAGNCIGRRMRRRMVDGTNATNQHQQHQQHHHHHHHHHHHYQNNTNKYYYPNK